MSFANAPVTRTMIIGLIGLSIAASLFDAKHFFWIVVDTHIFKYRQLWRIPLYQLCYTNSSEALVAAMLLYNVRMVERMWGSRKLASFVLTNALFTAVIPPALTAVLGPMTFGFFNYIPAGPTPIVFAMLAQYYAMIPHIFKYRVALSTSEQTRPKPDGGDNDDETFSGLTFTDKSYRYGLALQLAMSQWPGSLLGACVGWIVGLAWRRDILPGRLTRWRVPGWLVGINTERRSSQYEGLRRRLENEGSAAGTASGINVEGDSERNRRRQN